MLTTHQPRPLRARLAQQRREYDRRAGIVLPGRDEGSPAHGREFVHRRLSAWGVPAVRVEDAMVIVSELATNAVRHTASPRMGVVVAVTNGRVIVSVTDRGPHQPIRPHAVDEDAEHGRGLAIVVALATRWGYRIAGPGTCVWAHLPYTTEEFSR